MRNLISKLINRAPAGSWDSRGLTELETALIVIAAVVISSGLGFGVISSALPAVDELTESVFAGFAETRSALQLTGPVIAKSNDGSAVEEIIFQVQTNAAAPEPIDLTPGVTTIQYIDSNQSLIFAQTGDFTFTVEAVGNANDDNIVEPGELYQITVHLDKLETRLFPRDTFTVAVIPAKGGVVQLDRTVPPALDGYNDLG